MAAGGLETFSTSDGCTDKFGGDADAEEGDPIDWCVDPEGGLRPHTIRGGESSGESVTEGADDKAGGVETCGGVDIMAGDELVGGPGADMASVQTAGAVEL